MWNIVEQFLSVDIPGLVDTDIPLVRPLMGLLGQKIPSPHGELLKMIDPTDPILVDEFNLLPRF